jgi:UDP-glucose 4-epimerase
MKQCFVTGGAGFIGANLIRRLLAAGAERITVYDNFSVGRREHLDRFAKDGRLRIVEGDVRDDARLVPAMAGHGTVFHLAANSDIAAAASDPAVDFEHGTKLTHCVLEAMRRNDVKRIFFTSGSGVYGDVPPTAIPEDYDKMQPISTYGASKLASEVLMSAYAHMFGIRGTVTRFANVVGPVMTHGVTHDFIRRLMDEPRRLRILGDGQQTKPYIHVDEIIDAWFLIEREQKTTFGCFNVGSDDQLTVREIADIVVEILGLRDVAYDFTGGARGWAADVPIYKLDTTRIKGLGWTCRRTSRQAVTEAAKSLLDELRSGDRP